MVVGSVLHMPWGWPVELLPAGGGGVEVEEGGVDVEEGGADVEEDEEEEEEPAPPPPHPASANKVTAIRASIKLLRLLLITFDISRFKVRVHILFVTTFSSWPASKVVISLKPSLLLRC
jgi:hypothetical protein